MDYYAGMIGLHTDRFAERRLAFLSADKSMSHEVALLGKEGAIKL